MPCGPSATATAPPDSSHRVSAPPPQSPRTASFLSLRGLERRSLCCNAAIRHPHRITDESISLALVVKCAHCRRTVEDFAVVNEDGDRVWPVPDDFVYDESTPIRRMSMIAAPTHEIHVDIRTSRKLFR